MHLALHPVPASSAARAHQAPAPDPFDPIGAAHADLAASGRGRTARGAVSFAHVRPTQDDVPPPAGRTAVARDDALARRA